MHTKTGTIKYIKGMDLTEAEDLKTGSKNIYRKKKIFMTQITKMVLSLT